MALMLGALMIHGIAPGPMLMTARPELFWGLVASFWIGNVLLVVLNVPLIGLWVRILSVPYQWLYPAILVMICIGVYSVNNNVFDVYLALVFGLLGYAMRMFGFEPAPLLIGFVLGPMIEEKDLQTLANVDQDLQARLDALIPVRGRNYSSRVPVRVTIRSAGGGASVGNLRIAYTPVALLDRPPAGQSSGLLSRSGEALTLQLPAANYYLWAADALSYERRSPLLRVDVRAQAGVDALAADLLVP